MFFVEFYMVGFLEWEVYING